MTTPDFSCEPVASCRKKLGSTKGKTRGFSGVDVGFSDPVCRGWELINDVAGEAVVGVRGLAVGVLVQSVDSAIFF